MDVFFHAVSAATHQRLPYPPALVSNGSPKTANKKTRLAWNPIPRSRAFNLPSDNKIFGGDSGLWDNCSKALAWLSEILEGGKRGTELFCHGHNTGTFGRWACLRRWVSQTWKGRGCTCTAVKLLLVVKAVLQYFSKFSIISPPSQFVETYYQRYYFSTLIVNC